MFPLLSILLTLQLVVGEDYHDTLDGVVFEEYSTEQLRDFLHCILDKGPCSDVVASYKTAYPEVMINACQYCTEELKQGGYHFYNRLRKDLPKKYEELRHHFDPDNKYYDNFYRVLEQSVNKNKV